MKSLSVVASLELPPDDRSDEVTLQVLRCSSCRFERIAVYEESRRGALDSECWQHDAYRASRDAVRALRRMIRECPDARNPRCECGVHERLSGPGGYREALPGVEWDAPLALRLE